MVSGLDAHVRHFTGRAIEICGYDLGHHRGESFETSDAQLVNYTNIQSEGELTPDN